MTAAAQETSSPDYRIYIGIENKDKEESLVQVGVAWKHQKGNGLNLVMESGGRYTFFPYTKS